MDKRYLSEKVAEWYLLNKRDLPWRETRDPYRIWLSEIILQQTRVVQGMPYYHRFVENFPDVYTLAAASEQNVLRLWQGLGYYTRARNLHKCAREVVAKHNGQFPRTFEALRKLPGIGEYTAAAVASFSFFEKVAVVDGNVYRVLARIFGIDVDTGSPEGKKLFTTLANELVDPEQPDRHNQAMMEFGALLCTPKNPNCGICPFSGSCFAARNDLQDRLPVKKKLKAARKRYFYYFVIRKGNSLLMKKREEKDIWHGLFDFYLVERERPIQPSRIFMEDPWLKSLRGEVQNLNFSPYYKHILTHQTIMSRFITMNIEATPVLSNFQYYSLKNIGNLPKPVLITRFLQDNGFL